MTEVRALIEATITAEWGRITAALFRRLGDLELAEDAAQDAMELALLKWPQEGIPENPAGWLMRVGSRKAIDHFRRQSDFRAKQDQIALLTEMERDADTFEADEASAFPDERLGLIFTCCHPALSTDAQVALTLKTVGGISTAEIARAFLVTEATMAQRLVRAKRKIKAANVPFDIPDPEHWEKRLASVLSVIYFIFNEGYAPTHSDAGADRDLCAEAIRLGRILSSLLPEEPEVLGLAALMLLHDARAKARSDADGSIIPLEAQDRSRWQEDKIKEGAYYLKSALDLDAVGAYQLQAIISASHDQAVSFEETDWQKIVTAYEQLNALSPSPVLLLNKAVAISFAEDADAGLAALQSLEVEPRLAAYQPYHAARADILRRSGAVDQARIAYDRAIQLSDNEAEKSFLSQRKALLKPWSD